ncbi:MAG: DUF1295 domain-containing protein [Chitinophagales bacterium]|nr:DUF1295 domain-containing protein [Chitinophagales bacterium]
MNPWLESIILTLACVSSMYILSRLVKRNDLMDVFWGLGFAIICFFFALRSSQFNTSKLALLFIVCLWAVRLSVHILVKNYGKAEDFRYQNWRKEWGKTEWWRSFLQIYLLQGFFMFLIALPIIAYMIKVNSSFTHSTLQSPIDAQATRWLGGVISLLGLFIESIADFQKSVFKKKNPNGLMKTGMWGYSRHPNYFGEAIYWWGIAFFTWSEVSFVYGTISALIITILLRYVSGVPMLEKAKEGDAAYEQYKKETPVFMPFIGT